MNSLLIPTGYERALPPGVQVTVRARRARLAQTATGRVLDLGGADSHEHLWAGGSITEVVRAMRVGRRGGEAAIGHLVDAGQRFDTIFSVFQCIAVTSLEYTLDQLRGLLAPDGRLLFLEPGRAAGAAGRAQRLASLPVGLTTGWHLDRDVPAALRGAGFTVTDLVRHRSRTMQPWARWLVEGTARPALDLPNRIPRG